MHGATWQQRYRGLPPVVNAELQAALAVSFVIKEPQ